VKFEAEGRERGKGSW